jgi:predicted dinucleotide-binding enzyme
MKVAVIGRGNVGGGLADLWERAGHEVRRIGREGADVSDAETVVVAVPGSAVAEALDNVQGIEGKTVIDATNLIGVDPPAGFVQRRIREVEDERPDGEVVQHKLRRALRSDWRSALDTEQLVVRRRGGASGC